MILEALQHFIYPAPKHIKRMGYLREALAIEARYKRCARHWQPHLQKCKSIIMNEVSGLPEGARVMIVGSGGLHDVPVNELLAMKLKIDCIDIFHLPSIKRTYPGIRFIEKDVTGLAHLTYQTTPKEKFEPSEYQTGWHPDEHPDLVISLNILSQLPMTLVSFAKNHQVDLPERFEVNIRQAHIAWLKNICPRSLLITDIKRDYFHKGDLIQSDPALTDRDYDLIGSPEEQWIWNIAPVGETEKDIGIEHTVGKWTVAI